MNATTTGVCCPRCRRTDTTPLAIDEDRQRHQCNGCGEGFWAPATKIAVETASAAAPSSRFAHVPIAAPERSDLRVIRDIPMGTCPKCEKPYYKLGKRFEAHVEKCPGVKFVAPQKRQRREVVFTTPIAPDLNLIYDQSIAAIRARRAALEAEMMGLDLAIAEIEKRKGAGGSAPVPFAHGSPVKPSSLSSPQASAAI